jgi:CheY-like chemotaxis protein
MKTASILVVEHDVLVRHPLAEYLRECGYRVLEAITYDEARECLLDGRYTIDVALIDMNGPTNAGFALSTWIKTNYPSVRTLLGGTIAKVLALAGDLCEDGPHTSKRLNYRPVLDHIRRLLAAKGVERPPSS